jgi:hypothetical protein
MQIWTYIDTNSHKLNQVKIVIIICQTSNQSADDSTNFCYKSYNNIGCDDDDDMEYTEDAIDNMILEFPGEYVPPFFLDSTMLWINTTQNAKVIFV